MYTSYSSLAYSALLRGVNQRWRSLQVVCIRMLTLQMIIKALSILPSCGKSKHIVRPGLDVLLNKFTCLPLHNVCRMCVCVCVCSCSSLRKRKAKSCISVHEECFNVLELHNIALSGQGVIFPGTGRGKYKYNSNGYLWIKDVSVENPHILYIPCMEFVWFVKYVELVFEHSYLFLVIKILGCQHWSQGH